MKFDPIDKVFASILTVALIGLILVVLSLFIAAITSAPIETIVILILFGSVFRYLYPKVCKAMDRL